MDHPTAATAEPAPKYFPGLDGLRTFCCIAVIVGHVFQPLPAGATFLGYAYMGVSVFFVLSGFLITKLLLDEKQKYGRVDLKAFYLRRTLRIWPVYYAAVFLAFGLMALFGSRFPQVFGTGARTAWFSWPTFAALMAFVTNWVDAARLPRALVVLWSISTEEQFYLLFPVCFVFSRRAAPVFRVVALGLALTWVVRFFMLRAGYNRHYIYHNSISHCDELLFGALLAQLVHAAPALAYRLGRAGGAAGDVGAATAALALPLMGNFPKAFPLAWAQSALFGVVGMVLVARCAFGRGPLVRLLARPAPIALGRLTYAGYVFHIYAIVVATRVTDRLFGPTYAGAAACTALTVPLTFAIAYLTRVTFEERILALKNRFQRVDSAPAGLTGGLAPARAEGPDVAVPSRPSP